MFNRAAFPHPVELPLLKLSPSKILRTRSNPSVTGYYWNLTTDGFTASFGLRRSTLSGTDWRLLSLPVFRLDRHPRLLDRQFQATVALARICHTRTLCASAFNSPNAFDLHQLHIRALSPPTVHFAWCRDP